MKKNILAFLLTLSLIFAFTLPSFATYEAGNGYSYDYMASVYGATLNPAHENVYDLCDKLTDEEEIMLSSYIAANKGSLDLDLNFLVFDNACNRSTTTFVDDFYDFYISKFAESNTTYNGDGILIAIDFDNRQVYINTVGSAISHISDSEIENVLDATYSYATNEDYVGFFENTLKYTLDAYNEEEYATPVKLVDKLIPSLDSLIVSSVLTVVVIVILKSVHDKNNKAASAIEYMDGGLAVHEKNVIPMGVRTEVIPDFYKQQSSSGGGGGSFHSSGGGGSHGGGGHGF